jgi:hypothetical protein
MSIDCKTRVGVALRSGRDPLDAGQIFPTEDAALGSYYLFYSGVKQALPELAPPPIAPAPRTEVANIPGQGKGVLARQAFQTGELIAAERPVLVLPAVDMSLSTGARTVQMRNWCLSQLMRTAVKSTDLAAIASLHNAHPGARDGDGDYAGVFNTNALSIPSLPGHDAPYGALCVHLARINHSYVYSPHLHIDWTLL